MSNLVDQLAALDFAAIDDALGRVRSAVDVDGGLDFEMLDVASLLGDLGPIIDAVQGLENDPDSILDLSRVVLAELERIVDIPEIGELAGLIDGLASLSRLVVEIVDILSSSEGSELVDRLLTRVGDSVDLPTLVGDVVGRSADALGLKIPDPLQIAFDQLARLGGGVSDPRELATVVLGSIAGLDLDDVVRLSAGMDGFVTIVAGAGDHGALATLLAELDGEIHIAIALTGEASSGSSALSELVAVVDGITDRLDRLADVELPRFVDGLTTDLRSARNHIADLDFSTRLEGLRVQIPRPGIEPLEVLIEPLREIAAALDSVTAASVNAALDEARGEITAFATAGPLGDLLAGIEDAQRRLIRMIRSLPLEAARDAVVAALRDVQHEILAFRGFDVLDDVVAPVRELIAPLEEFDTSSVQDAVQELVDMVNGVFADFPIDDLREAIDAIVDPLGAILDEAAPLIEGVVSELEGLVAEIDAIDFDAAGAEVLEALAEIRGKIHGALSTDAVPDALKALIAGVAATLQAMDLGIELSDPFNAAIDVIDIDTLLEPVTEIWDELRAALLRATPDALITELDPPFDDLLQQLDRISLAPLTDALSDLFDELLRALRRADPRVVLAPLEAEFEQLLTALRAVLDPAPLFEPVRFAYAELQGLIGSIDIEAAMADLLGGIADTPTMLTDAVGEELQRRQDGVGVIPEADDEAFRFGDILRPFAALVAEIRSRLHALGEDVVGDGLGIVADATRTLRGLLDPALGMTTRVADSLDQRRQWFDPHSGNGALSAGYARLAGLQDALDELTLDATARAQLSAAVGPVRLEARLELGVTVTGPATAELERTVAAASPVGAGRSVRLLASALDDLLPEPLLDGLIDPRVEVATFIDVLIDAVDPAPLVSELDTIGEQISSKLAEFVDELSVGLLTVWNELFAGLEPLMPSSVAARLQAVLDAVSAELTELDPGVVEDEARLVVHAAVGLLSLHSPARVAAELGLVFDAALGIVENLDPAALLGDLDPFADLRADLELLRPSVILAPLVDRTAALTAALELVGSLDLDIAGELVAELTGAFTAVLEGVEREWDALLNELSSLAAGTNESQSLEL